MTSCAMLEPIMNDSIDYSQENNVDSRRLHDNHISNSETQLTSRDGMIIVYEMQMNIADYVLMFILQLKTKKLVIE